MTTKAIILLIAITVAIILVINSTKYVLGLSNYSLTYNKTASNETNSMADCTLERAVKTNGTWLVQSNLDCGEIPPLPNISRLNIK